MTKGILQNHCILDIANDPSPGIEPPYVVHGGIFREEAIMLLRRFYVQQNDKGELEKPQSGYEVLKPEFPIQLQIQGSKRTESLTKKFFQSLQEI